MAGLTAAAAADEADPNIDFVGIRPLLAAACEQLDVGEMVQSSTFNLFEAMSAVEIGNPKMDAGARPKVARAPLHARPLPLDLSKPQLLAWMDRLLALEATWHIGGALAQTVYTSLHMMQIGRLGGNATMAGYCRGLHALCHEVNALVLQGCVCEEEDFVCYAVGLPVEREPEGADKVLGALSLAMDAQDAGMAASSARGGSGGGSQTAAEDAKLAAALLARLHLRKLLYQAVTRMRQRTKQDLDAAHKCLLRASSELAAVRASAGLAAPYGGDSSSSSSSGDGGGPEDAAAAAAWAELGFDPTVNSHLAPPAPPRVVKVMSTTEAFDYFERLIEQLQRACRITHVADFTALEQFVLAYSAGRPCAVARSALHLQLAQHPTLEQAAAAGGPPAPPQLTPAQQPWAPSPTMMRAATSCLPVDISLGEDSDLFTEQALIAVGNWVQAVLLNPARHRRRLRRGLEDWCHLYQHGINADSSEAFTTAALTAGWRWPGGGEYPEPVGPLSCWVERQTARIVAAHMLMGFELELYEPRDYAMLYWYIDYLYGVIDHDSRTLAAGRPNLATVEAAAKALAASKAGSKVPKGLGGDKRKAAGSSAGGAGKAAPAIAAAPAAIRSAGAGDQFQSVQAMAMRHLCQGLMNMVVGLSAAGILSPPPLPFNSMAERFDQRFGSFHILTRPEPLTYEHFAAAVDLKDTKPQALLSAAGLSLAKAAQAFKAMALVSVPGHVSSEEHAHECSSLERVATSNRLACMVAERALTAGTSLDLSFTFNQHRSFPVAVLKSKK